MSLPPIILDGIQAMNTLIRQEEQVKERMKPFKDELKVVNVEKKRVMEQMVDHLRSSGGTIIGDGWEICPGVREKKTFSIHELEGVVEQHTLQSLMPSEEELVFPLKKRKRSSVNN